MITEARLGDLLAAIGNHEGKALMFLAMEDEVPYGTTSSYRRFIEIQGSPPAFVGQVTVAQKYLVHSFLPIGLVVRQRNESGFLRHVREDPDGVATALAGFLLASTADADVSLQILFGKTSAREGSERSPIRRYRILRALAEAAGDTYPARVAAQARVGEMPTSNALTAFAEHGLLTLETSATYEMRTTYRITEPIPPQVGKGNYRTATEISEYLNGLLAKSPGELVVPREQIEAHLRAFPRWAEVGGLRDITQGILKRFVTRGYLEAVTSHYGLTHARVSLTPAQRAFAARVSSGIAAIAAGDPQAITAGHREARRILKDPDAVRALMRRGFAASKLANNPMTEGEKVRLVAEAVAKAPGSTTEELLVITDPRFTRQLIRGTLSLLAKRGEVVAVKQPDGPYHRFYPPADDQPRLLGSARRPGPPMEDGPALSKSGTTDAETFGKRFYDGQPTHVAGRTDECKLARGFTTDGDHPGRSLFWLRWRWAGLDPAGRPHRSACRTATSAPPIAPTGHTGRHRDDVARSHVGRGRLPVPPAAHGVR